MNFLCTINFEGTNNLVSIFVRNYGCTWTKSKNHGYLGMSVKICWPTNQTSFLYGSEAVLLAIKFIKIRGQIASYYRKYIFLPYNIRLLKGNASERILVGVIHNRYPGFGYALSKTVFIIEENRKWVFG